MANDYATLSDVKSYLAIDNANTNSDTLLSTLITACSGYIENWTNRVFALASTVYKCNGNGSNIMLVKNYPINSVTSVTINGQTIPASDGTTTGYVFDDHTIYLIGYTFTKGFQNVSVSFSYGYASTPSDIKQVCVEMVAYKFKETERIGIRSKTLAGEVVSFDIRDMKDHNKNILNNYNRVVPL